MALWKREQNKNIPVHFGHGSHVSSSPEYTMLRLRKKAVDVGVVASRRWLQSSCAMRSSFGMVRRNDARLAAVVLQADGSRCQFYPRLRLRHPVTSCGKSNDALEKLTETLETCLYLVSGFARLRIGGNLLVVRDGCVHFLAPCVLLVQN